MASNYLISDTGTDGKQLWILDPASGTLSELSDIYPGQYNYHYHNTTTSTYGIVAEPNSASPHNFTTFGAGVLFAAAGPSTGTELWVSDGTQAGTHLIKDILPGSKTYESLYSKGGAYQPGSTAHHYTRTVFYGSDPTNFVSLGNKAVFNANDGTYSSGLWVTDGSTQGTQRIFSGVAVASTGSLPNGDLLFSGAPGNQSAGQLWVTDGTVAGTQLVATINPSGNPNISDLTIIGNQALFSATDGTSTNELWVSDSTAAGTRLVTDINPTEQGNTPKYITPFGTNEALFLANDGTHGFEPWIFDGTNASLLQDVNPGSGDVYGTGSNTRPYEGFAVFTTAGGKTEAVFAGSTPRTGRELWITDGTSSGTKLLDNISPDMPGMGVDSNPRNLTPLSSRVVFTASYNSGVDATSKSNEFWVTDGTYSGTAPLLSKTGQTLYIDNNVPNTPLDSKRVGSELYFLASTAASSSSYNLWVTDGTSGGTHMVSSQALPTSLNLADTAAPCYLKGTRILTPAGEIVVEALRVGDLVVTFDGAARPIRWIGTRLFADDHPAWRTALPVLIREGALADNMPTRDLYVSPDHALYLAGVLIPAQFLVNGRTIVRSKRHKAIEYFHIELDSHNLLLAEGAPAETYRDDGNRGQFDNALDLTGNNERDMPVTGHADDEVYAPLVEDGLLLEEVQRYLSERAELLGHQVTTDPDLRLISDGKTIRPTERHGDPEQDEIFTFELDGPPKKLSIRSNVGVPAEVVGSDDWRRLGVAFSRIVLRAAGLAIDIDHTAACLIEGFHAKEPLQRWTEGDGRLPPALFAPLTGPVTIEVHVRETLPYVTANVGSAIVESAARARRATQSATEETKDSVKGVGDAAQGVEDQPEAGAEGTPSLLAGTPLRLVAQATGNAINAL